MKLNVHKDEEIWQVRCDKAIMHQSHHWEDAVTVAFWYAANPIIAERELGLR